MTTPRVLRLSAADTLRVEEVSRLARSGAVDDLIVLLSEPSWAVRRTVVVCLARMAAAVDPLRAVLLGDRTEEKRLAAAVEALVASNGAADDAALSLIREGHTPAILCDAAQILGRRRCARAVAELVGLLDGTDDNVAAAAIEALGRIGGAGTVEPLIAAVEGRNFFRAFPAIGPLGRSADPRATAPLVGLLGEVPYAAEAAEALGRSAHLSAAVPLVALLVNEDDMVVRAAACALVRLRVHQEKRFDGAFASAITRAGFAPEARRRLRACVKGGRVFEDIALATVLGWLEDDTAIAELVELFRARSSDLEAVTGALVALGARAEPALFQAIYDGDSNERLHFLSIVKARSAGLAVFLACLDDPQPRVRAHACQALAKVGDVTVVPALFAHIGDPNAHASQSAVAAIQSLGCAATKPMAIEAARSSDPRRRRAALRILAHFGFPEGLDVMVSAMADADDRIRDAAIYGLPFIEDARALAVLLEASESPTAHTRAVSMRALGQTSDQTEVTAALRRGIRDEDDWVRYYACQALGRLAICSALDEVIALIDDPAGQVRVAAIESVAKLGDGQATAVLDGACRSADPDIRRAALLGLGGCKRSEALPILLREAMSDDATTRLYAVSALAESDADEATDALVRAARDAAVLVASAATACLSVRSGPGATRWLIAQLLDPEAGGRVLVALQNPVPGRVDTIVGVLHDAEPPLASLLVAALTRMESPLGQTAIEGLFELDNVHARRAAALACAASGTAESRFIVGRVRLSDSDDEVRRICEAALR